MSNTKSRSDPSKVIESPAIGPSARDIGKPELIFAKDTKGGGNNQTKRTSRDHDGKEPQSSAIFKSDHATPNCESLNNHRKSNSDRSSSRSRQHAKPSTRSRDKSERESSSRPGSKSRDRQKVSEHPRKRRDSSPDAGCLTPSIGFRHAIKGVISTIKDNYHAGVDGASAEYSKSSSPHPRPVKAQPINHRRIPITPNSDCTPMSPRTPKPKANLDKPLPRPAHGLERDASIDTPRVRIPASSRDELNGGRAALPAFVREPMQQYEARLKQAVEQDHRYRGKVPSQEALPEEDDRRMTRWPFFEPNMAVPQERDLKPAPLDIKPKAQAGSTASATCYICRRKGVKTLEEVSGKPLCSNCLSVGFLPADEYKTPAKPQRSTPDKSQQSTADKFEQSNSEYSMSDSHRKSGLFNHSRSASLRTAHKNTEARSDTHTAGSKGFVQPSQKKEAPVYRKPRYSSIEDQDTPIPSIERPQLVEEYQPASWRANPNISTRGEATGSKQAWNENKTIPKLSLDIPDSARQSTPTASSRAKPDFGRSRARTPESIWEDDIPEGGYEDTDVPPMPSLPAAYGSSQTAYRMAPLESIGEAKPTRKASRNERSGMTASRKQNYSASIYTNRPDSPTATEMGYRAGPESEWDDLHPGREKGWWMMLRDTPAPSNASDD